MANGSKTSYYNYFKENTFDENALVQDYKGHILHREAGHVYVVKTFFGFYKIKGKRARFSFRWPFQQAKLVKNVETIGVVNFEGDLTTGDGLPTIQGQPIEFQYEVIDKKNYLKNLFENVDMAKNINSCMKDIISTIVSSSKLGDIRHTFSLNVFNGFVNGPDWFNNSAYDLAGQVNEKLKNLELKYGIKINSVLTIDFDEPEDIREARKAVEIAELKKQQAEIEREIKEKDYAVEAKREAFKVEEVLNRVKEFGAHNNIDGDRLAQLYIRAITPNATYTNTSFDIGAAASVLQNSQSQTSALQQMVTQQAATIQTLTQQIASMNAAIESMKAALQSQPVAAQAQPTVQSQATAQAQRVTAQAQQATAQAQQATAQAQQATAQAQQVTAQAQQATAQAQQTTVQAQQPVVDQPQPATKKSAVDAALGNKKLVRITSANRVPKASRTNRNGGARGPVPTPRRRSAQNSATQGGRSLR